MSRRSEQTYSIDEPPELVVKMHLVLLAAEVSNMHYANTHERLSAEHPHCMETAARWMRGQYDNSRQRMETEDTRRAAWALYRLLKDALKLDMNMIEREARRAARWW